MTKHYPEIEKAFAELLAKTGYKEIPLEQVVANPYTASPQEIHDGIVLYRVNEHFQEALLRRL